MTFCLINWWHELTGSPSSVHSCRLFSGPHRLPPGTTCARLFDDPQVRCHVRRDGSLLLNLHPSCSGGGAKDENKQWCMSRLAALCLAQGIDLVHVQPFVETMVQSAGVAKLATLLQPSSESVQWDQVSDYAASRPPSRILVAGAACRILVVKRCLVSTLPGLTSRFKKTVVASSLSSEMISMLMPGNSWLPPLSEQSMMLLYKVASHVPLPHPGDGLSFAKVVPVRHNSRIAYLSMPGLTRVNSTTCCAYPATTSYMPCRKHGLVSHTLTS